MDTSNVHVVLSTKTSSGASFCTSMAHLKCVHSPEVGTMHPLGLPVEPEVYMTYMTSGGPHGGTPSADVSMAVRTEARTPSRSTPAKSAPSVTLRICAVSDTSMTTASWSLMGTARPVGAASRMTAHTLASVRMSLMRDSGHEGSQGTKVAPALNAASSAMGSAAVRRRTRPTVKVVLPDAREPDAWAAERISMARVAALAWTSSKDIFFSVLASVNHVNAARPALEDAAAATPGARPKPTALASFWAPSRFHALGMQAGDHSLWLVSGLMMGVNGE
mmetsp:Transcript_11109/g.32997  ORF Transcript_11109/g.32997 Transcript_11109/m.32997 type:complete len:277 (-) Transcript_11109:54-884(-)